jgi:hypothetical protein
VLTNRGLNLQGDAKSRRIRELLGDVGAHTPAEEALAALERVLADHEGASIFDRICVHSAHYGTRSATLLAIHGRDAGRSIYRHTEGPSCESPWKDVSDLFGSAPYWRSEVSGA